MSIQAYNEQKKELQNNLLAYIENESNDTSNLETLINCIESQKILEDQGEFRELLKLISKIFKNHHRNSSFIQKNEELLSRLSGQIKQTFSNSDIFEIFKNNKRLLLYLIQNQIIQIDKSIADSIIMKCEEKYFYPEIKPLISEKEGEDIKNSLLEIDSEIFDTFEKNRQTGENESIICELIRNDSVEEFISYVTKVNFDLNYSIKPSIFETNSFLIGKNPKLIEYSAFYGSIQILQFLSRNKIELKPSLWLYAIHSNDADMIHFLEQNQISPSDSSYEECIHESIKCHHNDIAAYIHENYLDKSAEEENLNEKYNSNVLYYSFRYYNYSFFPDDFGNKFIILYLCQFNYHKLVFLLLDSMTVNVNITTISNQLIINDYISNQFFFV
ncbi:hypothetical protein M9Y10_044245 [Tritrichomonas musculus]|uniref:DUF3447 domain-containing protein n=1 Tax=Tritrichomonas musculus TaxID=1915356 RepID=A0ABR2K1X1_9EUKA